MAGDTKKSLEVRVNPNPSTQERLVVNSNQEDAPFFQPPYVSNSEIFWLPYVITDLIAIVCNILLINFYLDK